MIDFRLPAALYQFLGREYWVTVAIVMGAAVLEGIGLVALAPLLSLALGEGGDQWWNELAGDLAAVYALDRDALLLLAIGLFGTIILVRGLCVRAREVRLVRHSLAFTDHLRLQLIEAIAHAPWKRVSSASQSDIEHAVLSDVRRLQVGISQSLRAAASLVLVATQIAAAFLLAWKLALVALACLIVVAGAFLSPLLASHRLGGEATLYGQRSHEALGRFLTGFKLYKANGREDVFLGEFRGALRNLLERTVDFARVQADAGFLGQIAAAAVLVVVAVAGLIWLDLPLAIVGLFVLIFARLAQLTLNLLRGVQAYAHMLPAYDHLVSLLADYRALDEAIVDDAPPPLEVSHVAPVAEAAPMSVAAVGLRFAIGGSSPALLDGVNFAIEPGQFVALVGPSGAGKTTLLDLIVGLLAPDAGELLLDGKNVDQPRNEAARAAISYVPQDPVFFDTSLRRNLASLSNVSDEGAMWWALRQACADRIPAIQEHGLNVRLGDQGQKFSGGERQRLGLARAILSRPRLLILDESLSALDRDTEQQVLKNLVALTERTTIVLATHRLPSRVRIDQILSIEDGRIISSTPQDRERPGLSDATGVGGSGKPRAA